jgi:hypothetical protein
LTAFSLNAYSPPFRTKKKGDIPAQGRNTPLTKKDTKRRLAPPSCASFVWSSVL